MSILGQNPINQPTGTQVYGPVTVPNPFTQMIVRIARCTSAAPTMWPNAATEVDFFVEITLDGGATWLRLCGATSFGGIVIGKDSLEAPESTVSSPIPPGTGRRLRATVTVANGPFVSQITLEAT